MTNMEFKWDLPRDVPEKVVYECGDYKPFVENYRVLIKADGVLPKEHLPEEYLRGYPRVYKSGEVILFMDKSSYNCDLFEESNFVTYKIKVCKEDVPAFNEAISISDMEDMMNIAYKAGKRLSEINRRFREKEAANIRELEITTYRI
ncbi:MAG: hypothetical protein M0R80_03790 [Proteobacteria bacterium]|jgi:hypothetical protein|nr:hypothetical protein [Pseudomonadota bacterium]